MPNFRRLHSSSSILRLCLLVPIGLTLFAVSNAAAQASSGPPLKSLFVTGGVYHDYDKLSPYLTSHLSQLINIRFEIITDLSRLSNANFADGYDVIVYDLCLDDVDRIILDHAIRAGFEGKPTVFIHCGIHSFRNSQKIREWENYVGLRSKFHDTFGPFSTQKTDPASPITKSFPSDWKTSGDELYQTIEVISGTQPLLTAKSPLDGRVHIVAWVHNYGKGRVFATTLGHDFETANSPAYVRLLANGLLWTCNKLSANGAPEAGYAASGAN